MVLGWPTLETTYCVAVISPLDSCTTLRRFSRRVINSLSRVAPSPSSSQFPRGSSSATQFLIVRFKSSRHLLTSAGHLHFFCPVDIVNLSDQLDSGWLIQRYPGGRDVYLPRGAFKHFRGDTNTTPAPLIPRLYERGRGGAIF